MAYNREVEFRNVVLHNLFMTRLLPLEKQIRRINISETPDTDLRDQLVAERDYLYGVARDLGMDLGAIRIALLEGVRYG